jgi:hypothetical protein
MHGHKKKPLVGRLAMLAACSMSVCFMLEAANAAGAVAIDRSIQKSEVVARVKIKRIVPQTYVEGEQNVRCGTTYQVDVLEDYKGEPGKELSFSAYGTPLVHEDFDVKEDDELLVMLNRRMSDDDPYYLNHPDEVIAIRSRNKLGCLLRLAKFSPTFGYESAMLLRERPNVGEGPLILWMLYDERRTLLPRGVKNENVQLYSNACINPDGDCIKDPKRWVRWSAVENEVAKAARK